MGYLYTVLQLVGLFLVFFTPPILPQTIYGQIILFLSLVIGVWAIFAFRHTRINIFPYLRNGAILIRKGPYKYVRHPMYSSVLLFALAYFIDNPNWIFTSYFVGLTIVILLKMRFEEKQLMLHFKNYDAEFFKTYRIIPCVY
jgi:protein-S-isoprenylcysteine O-methyltransferase Ste14